eukprot:TRINITY_DN3973_c0_g1_i1.p1 TRINITY_DN3973_c0_g1~~TRINITY_DN3973_c0_g1_i1.p1  ORF type:complete len:230 (+),score=22.27 TRINITY_DN3973_c0_g1_i1:33-722(+)
MGGDESKQAKQDFDDLDEARPETTVYLNVYNITDPNFMNTVGFGLYHSGVEVYGREYSYGKTESSTCGIFWLRPRSAVAAFKEAIPLGKIRNTPEEVQDLIDSIKESWNGLTYNVLSKNCNTFSDTFVRLLGLEFPDWVNRAARWGDRFVPDAVIRWAMDKFLQDIPPGDEMDSEDEDDLYEIPGNLPELTIRELRTIMFVHKIEMTNGALEKSDLVGLIQQHKEKKGL